MANGFANRFLFCCVRRSKLLPHGGALPEAELAGLARRLKTAVEFARQIGRVEMTAEAAEAWSVAYPELSAERPGLVGAIIARAEAQVIRLSLIFALLDMKDTIAPEHLEGAMAIWAYCEASALRIFGDSLGDPVADDILRALRLSGPGGMTRTEISQPLRSPSEIRPDRTRVTAAQREAPGPLGDERNQRTPERGLGGSRRRIMTPGYLTALRQSIRTCAKSAKRPPGAPLIALNTLFAHPEAQRQSTEGIVVSKCDDSASAAEAHQPPDHSRTRAKRAKSAKSPPSMRTGVSCSGAQVPGLRRTQPLASGDRRTGGGFWLHGTSRPMRSAGQRVSCLACTPRPSGPAANYRRLSRYDETGLIWLLRGRPVVALTATTAAIQGATGILTSQAEQARVGPAG